MALNIPERFHQVVADLFKLDSSEKQDLINVLKNVPHGSNPSEYEQEFEAAFPKTSGDWRDSFLQFVFSMSNLADSEKSVETIANDFIEALKKIDNEKLDTTFDDSANLMGLREFVLQILNSQDTLGLGAKAFRLIVEHGRIFYDCEIISDIRTVFPQAGPENRPIAAMVYHTLKIETHSSSNHHEDIFLALTYKDLEQLEQVVVRAKQKHKTLSSMISTIEGIRYLEPLGEVS